MSVSRIKIVIIYNLLIAIFFLFIPYTTYAASEYDQILWGGYEDRVQETTGLGARDPRLIAASIVRVLLGFLGIIVLMLFFFSGMRWMVSFGDEENVLAAKKTMSASMAGLAIILMSFAIAEYMLNAFAIATGAVEIL